MCDVCTCRHREALTVSCNGLGLSRAPEFTAGDAWIKERADVMDLSDNPDLMDIPANFWDGFARLTFVGLRKSGDGCVRTLLPSYVSTDGRLCPDEVSLVSHYFYITTLHLIKLKKNSTYCDSPFNIHSFIPYVTITQIPHNVRPRHFIYTPH